MKRSLVVLLLALAVVAVGAPAATRILNLYVLSSLTVGTIPVSPNTITKTLAGSVDYDFPPATIVCNDSIGTTVTGATVGDPCFVGLSTPTDGGFNPNSSFNCFVSATNTVKVRHCAAGTATDPGDAGYAVRLLSSQ